MKKSSLLRIELSRRQVAGGLASLMLFGLILSLSSETMMMTTFYPAPMGVYQAMITTGRTILARDGGNVIIGNNSRVGIGTENPNASAIVDIAATNRGLLLPRMTTVQRNAIAGPANGLLVYNTDTNKFNYYSPAGWRELGESDTRWTPLVIPLGTLPYDPTIAVYNIPGTVPATAKEILVYVMYRKGVGRNRPDSEQTYTIYTQDGATRYSNKLAATYCDNKAWVFNSDNLWLPITPERKIYASLDGSVSNNRDSTIQILGYR